MERSLTFVPVDVTRATIAALTLGELADHQLGSIRLRPHQRTAVARLRRMLREHGGALLADDVGLGKTYVALALARDAASPLIVMPASLRGTWQRALEMAGVSAVITSYERLSRSARPDGEFDLVVLDEAHHARSPGTRRYALLSSICSRARVLLLSATPVHNDRRELSTLLALFLGARALRLSLPDLSRHVVRRELSTAEGATLPELAETRVLQVGDDAATLKAILALPAPLPPRDGGHGGTLLTISLVRQWASSDAALAAALRRRLATAEALLHALRDGRYPTRAELLAWVYAEDSLQLAFPELIVAGQPARTGALVEGVQEHALALRALLDRLTARPSLDEIRAAGLRAVRGAHPDERIIAFAQFTETVQALYARLRLDGAVAALSSRGGIVAGGRLTRLELLRRFAPRALGIAPPSASERIDLLLTTDLLSEGLDVHDASVVVHMDLPWTPARMEQRVGRSRRLGAMHARTSVYALAPPASADEMTRVQAQLRAKLAESARAVGVSGAILPDLTSSGIERESRVRARELLFDRLRSWSSERALRSSSNVLVSVVASERRAILAAVRDVDILLVGCADDEHPSDDPSRILELLPLFDGPSLAAGADGEVARAIASVESWIARRRAAALAGSSISIAGSSRRAAMQRIARMTSRLPLHRRSALLPLAARARQAIATPFGIGAERVLGELAVATLPDEAWLRAIGAFGQAHGLATRDVAEAPGEVTILVLLIASPRR